ncbi:McrC family protein [Aneurinibacillus sp. REN35]|uniref:McrC family protein n=1 Tax=Aneurinibacillus sp. REN35 TaxID=3237286 RepID=UPI003529BFA9
MKDSKPIYRLKEYETVSGLSLSPESVAILRTEFHHVVTLRSAPMETWDVMASSYIGRIELSDAAIYIMPKVTSDTVWHWLSVAYDISSLRLHPPSTQLGEWRGDVEWLVKAFMKECASIVRSGLRSGYETRVDSMENVRGALRIAPTLGHWMKQEYHFVCAYDEPTRSVPVNRLLYAGLYHMAQRDYHDARVRLELLRLCAAFAPEKGEERDVAERTTPSEQLTALAHLSRTHFTRSYTQACAWLALYWRSCGLSMHKGEVLYDSFVLDMNELFERYVALRLQTALLQHDIEVIVQPHHWLGEEGQIRIVPDLVLRHQSGEEIVVDTKYKLRTGQGENADVFQMLAYLTARSSRSGVLVYAAREERVDRILHTDKTIYRWSLGLDVPMNIEEQEAHMRRMIQRLLALFV